MVLRKGFKAEAARLAEEVRRELGLDSLDRLDPWRLARHLERLPSVVTPVATTIAIETTWLTLLRTLR